MIRIGIDAQIADVSQAGIGQFTARVCEALPRVDRDAAYVEFHPENRAKDFSMPERLWWDQVVVPRLARRERVDVLLKPAFSCPVHSRIPTVAVLHDLAARLFPEQLNRPSAWFFGRFAPWTLRFAARVIATSENTATDARRLLRIPDARLRIVLQGVDVGLTHGDDRLLARFSLPDRFILYVGTIEPRKNLAFLVRTFAALLKRHPDYALVLAGRDGWKSDDVHDAVRSLHLEKQVRFIGEVSQDELVVLYKKARVLAYPSLYEGFGRTPLEAMAVGTPVVAARNSSIPEVVGDAGILISGYDEGKWALHLARAAEDPVTRSRLQKVGAARSKVFTWERAARMIADICHEVAHESGIA